MDTSYEADSVGPQPSGGCGLGSVAMVGKASGLLLGSAVGLVSIIAALVFLLVSKQPWPRTERPLLLPAGAIVVYIATYFVLPPLGRATIAFTALALTLSSLRLGRSFHLGLFGLFYLFLPIIPTLQFFGGYPMRVFVAKLTAPILRLGGFAVVPEGTCLNGPVD